MKKNIKIIIAAVILFSGSLFAQELLTPQNAVKIALENNYSIKIASNNKDVADNNASMGNAGFLPSLDASGSYTRSSNDTKQNYANGQTVDVNGAINKNYAAGINLNWTIFDGLKMFASLDQLKELKKMGETNYRKAVETNISDVLSTYYDIVRQELILEVIKKNISISEERLDIVKNEKSVGAASKFDLLKAQVDLNTDKSNLLTQEESLQEAKVKLNRLLGRDITSEFKTTDTIEVNTDLKFNDLKSIMFDKNSDLTIAQQNKNISELQLKLEKSEMYPKLSLNLGYNYSKSESGAGFFISSNTTSFSYGATVSLNLFDGLNTRRRIENAQVAIDNSEYEYNQAKDIANAALLNAYQKYENSLKLIKLETENYKAAEENADLALERLRVGTITPLDFRTSQKDMLDAKSRLVSAQYSAKNAEDDLLRISGLLIKSSK
ncbi:MAG TPA: TolC family protein [Ignavibacteriaceae bacterium]|nr:TolC family protein [Ignavibacteriaceae bacterium]